MSDDKTTKIGALNVATFAVWLVYAVAIIYLVILLLAFFLLLFGANPDAGFVDWVYHAADRIMAPFRGIFPTVEVTDKAVFEPSLLFAIVIYMLFALVVHSLVDWLSTQASRLRVARERDRYYQAVSGEQAGGQGYAAAPQGYAAPAPQAYPAAAPGAAAPPPAPPAPGAPPQQ